MAGQFTTGSAEMQQAVQSMDETNQNLQTSLKSLESAVEEAMSGWGGRAATAFQTLMSRFNEDATKMNQDLQQISEAVAGNSKSYQAQEDDASQQISSITSALGG